MAEAAAKAGLSKAEQLAKTREQLRSTARTKAEKSGLPEFLASAVTVDVINLSRGICSRKKRNHVNKLMNHPASKADVLSIPLQLAQHLDTVYDAGAPCTLKVSSRAYFMGVDEVSTKETSKVPELMSLIANPCFHKRPQFSSVLFKRKIDSGPDIYMLGQVRVLFSSQGTKYALVRMYDRVSAALAPNPTLPQLREFYGSAAYGVALRSFTPSAEEPAHESGCLQLRLVAEGDSLATQVIPLSWIVQSVFVMRDHSFPLGDRYLLNHWFWGAYA